MFLRHLEIRILVLPESVDEIKKAFLAAVPFKSSFLAELAGRKSPTKRDRRSTNAAAFLAVKTTGIEK